MPIKFDCKFRLDDTEESTLIKYKLDNKILKCNKNFQIRKVFLKNIYIILQNFNETLIFFS